MSDSPPPGAGNGTPVSHDPYAALRIASFRNFAAGNICSWIGMQMFTVAVGWELYQTTNSATALGLVGLFEVLPIVLLVIPAGHLVDRSNRKTVILIDQLLLGIALTLLATAALFHAQIPDFALLRHANALLESTARFFGDSAPVFHARHIPIIYTLIAINGILRSVNHPAKQSILPQLVPPQTFSNAVTWHSSFFELSAVTGPTLGGAVLALVLAQQPNSPWAYPLIYYMTAACQFLQVAFLLPVKLIPMKASREPFGISSLLAGLRFVYRAKIVLASITLDMFAVLLGGATALLPMIARDVLHVGPLGLGGLRSAPSIGAVMMALFVAHRPPMQRAGRNLLLAVAGFGLAMIVFGLSHNFYLSFLMLFASGACDNISVIVRHTLVQVLTPNEMRGRVSAVNSLFIACSNELGAFESGLTAAFFTGWAGTAAGGAVLSIVTGGVGTLVVVAAAASLFPELRRVGALSALGAQHE